VDHKLGYDATVGTVLAMADLTCDRGMTSIYVENAYRKRVPNLSLSRGTHAKMGFSFVDGGRGGTPEMKHNVSDFPLSYTAGETPRIRVSIMRCS
jgi:hypothetical protein